MKNFYLLSLSLLFFANSGFANTGDTTVIVAHTLSNLASPPSNDDVWINLLNHGITYQKIIMKFTLGCGTPNCSGWDYTVSTSLGKKSGTLDSTVVAIDTITRDTTWAYSDHVNFMELGRLITPYGTYMAGNSNGFNNNWTQPYYYDVTDYASILRDSVNVRVHYDGWSDAFSARVEFIFIQGPPSRPVESVKEIYNTYIDYPNSAGFENVATPKTFYIDSNVTSAKVLVIMTGHGNQGEFDPRYFHIKINNQEIYSHILWKDDCDMNAVAPQGGTWIFSRANWCPGDKVPSYEIDITPYITPGQNVSVDLDLDDFVIQSGASAGYGISAHLITYTQQQANDVMMEEIIAPNADKPYLHYNPSCTTPKVKIKNIGSQPLTYAEISYWVKGGAKWYYEWNGYLPPFESEIIDLPAFDYSGLDTNDRVFYAEAKWPNNVPDEYEYNDKLACHFNMTPQTDSVFYLYFKSNNQPWENSYVLKSEYGDTIAFKNSFAANTTYKDTFHLYPGSYAFDFFDFDSANWGCGDGLKFFVNQPPNATANDAWYETSGQINLRRLNNTVFKNFTSEFGRNIHYEFTVGYPLGFNTPKTAPTPPQHNTGIKEPSTFYMDMNVFPNPANDYIHTQVNLGKNTGGSVILSDVYGRIVEKSYFENASHEDVTMSTKHLAKGIYFITLNAEGQKLTRKVLLQ